MINNLPRVQLWDFKFKYNKNTLYQTVYKFGKQFPIVNTVFSSISSGSKPSNEGRPLNMEGGGLKKIFSTLRDLSLV